MEVKKKMNPNELRNLQEAYLDVYAGQQLDEGKKPLPTDKIKKKASRLAKDTLRDTGTAFNPFKSASERSAATSNIAKRQKRVDRMVDVLKDKTQKEELGIYDIILSHLIDEGYADTVESAEGIMVNMSEEWRDSIVEEVLDEGKMPLDKERRARIGRQIGNRIDSAGKDLAGSGAPFMPKSIRNNLRQSAAKKGGEVNKMTGALKSAQKK